MRHTQAYIRGPQGSVGKESCAPPHALLAFAIPSRAQAKNDDDPSAHAYLYRDGRMRDIGAFTATSLNDRSEVVGYELTAEGNRAVLYRSGKLHTLGTLAGADTYPRSINNCGEVVGEGVTAAGPHAFLHFKGEFVDLISVLPMPVARHVVLESASAINDRGQVAATGFDSKKGKWRSYLLTPPASSRCGHRRGNTEITEHCPCAMNR